MVHRNGGNSLAAQSLRLNSFTAVGPDLIPGQGTKIPQAMWYSQKQIFLMKIKREKAIVVLKFYKQI